MTCKNEIYLKKVNDAADLYITATKPLCKIVKEFQIKDEDLFSELYKRGYYYAKKGARQNTVVNVKNAAEEYCKLGGFPNTNLTEISKKYSIAPAILKKYLVEFYPDVRIYGVAHFHQDIFDTINTEEKAYWLGFIYADGFIDSSPLDLNKQSNYEFELSLALKDLEHLQKFAKFMGWENRVVSDSYRCRFFVNNKHLWNVLNTYGCTPRKSLTLKFPRIETFTEPELIRHFIRGYFDGDGCISHSDKKQTIGSFHLIGTSSFLTEVLKYLPCKDLQIRILHPTIDNITKFINTSGEKAKQIFHYLYNDCSIYLQRKYNLYIKYCRSLEESNELLQDNIGKD